MIDPGDVAAAAAAVLTGDGRNGEIYLLTGPETITYYDVAEHLSTVTGRKIQYLEAPDEQARQGLAQAGMPDWMADIIVSVLTWLRRRRRRYHRHRPRPDRPGTSQLRRLRTTPRIRLRRPRRRGSGDNTVTAAGTEAASGVRLNTAAWLITASRP